MLDRSWAFDKQAREHVLDRLWAFTSQIREHVLDRSWEFTSQIREPVLDRSRAHVPALVTHGLLCQIQCVGFSRKM